MQRRRLAPKWLLLLAFGLMLGVITAAAPAADVSARDAQQARAVVQAQIDAFKADDAVRAFSFAAPAIRAQFGDAERFVAMVRKAYPAVYRPASVTFLPPQWDDADLVQSVRLSDAEGSVWLATYRLERQPDKSWRIAGCELAELEGRAI